MQQTGFNSLLAISMQPLSPTRGNNGIIEVWAHYYDTLDIGDQVHRDVSWSPTVHIHCPTYGERGRGRCRSRRLRSRTCLPSIRPLRAPHRQQRHRPRVNLPGGNRAEHARGGAHSIIQVEKGKSKQMIGINTIEEIRKELLIAAQLS